MKSNKLNKSKISVIIPYKLCICCGKSGNLNQHSFEYHQEDAIAQFSVLTFIGIDKILGYVLDKNFIVQALFCRKCGRRIERIDFIGQIGHLAFVLLIFFTIILATLMNSYFGFEASLYTVGLGILLTIGFRIWFRYYNWKYFPKIKSINDKFVVMKIPGKGKIKLERV